jgi:UDP-glucose 4-epimerase
MARRSTCRFGEDDPLSPRNPYGRTKLTVEQIPGDQAASYGSLEIAILGYFNPAGAHESGLIGEDGLGTPGNLMSF